MIDKIILIILFILLSSFFGYLGVQLYIFKERKKVIEDEEDDENNLPDSSINSNNISM